MKTVSNTAVGDIIGLTQNAKDHVSHFQSLFYNLLSLQSVDLQMSTLTGLVCLLDVFVVACIG